MESSSPVDADSRTRLHRQEVVADVAQRALEADDLDRLLEDATAAVARALDCEYCGAFESRPGRGATLVAGVGWPAERVGEPFDAGEGTLTGAMLRNDDPLVVENYDADDRFSRPAQAPDVSSAVGAVVGPDDDPWGVLGAYATESVTFAAPEARFVGRVADVLGSAVENGRARSGRGGEPVESELDEVFSRVSDAFFALDEEWRFTYLNERAHELVNPGDRDLVGENVWEVFPEAVGRKFKPKYEQAMYEQETVSFEEYYPEPLDAWYEVRAYPSASGLSVYFRDVTDRKDRQRELERQQRRFEAVFEDPNILVGLLEPDGTVANVNRTAMQYVEADLEAVTGRPIWETPWWDEELQATVREWTERAAAGEYVDFETDTTSADGRRFAVEGVFRPVTDDDGDVVSLIVSTRDVTERKRHERELELFRRLLDYSNDSILVVDAETGQMEAANETACERRGYAREELLELTVPEFEHIFDDLDDWRDHVKELREGGPMTVEGVHHRKDGSAYPVEVNTTYVELDREYVVAIARDITERKERERELQRYEAIVETVNDGVYVVDGEGRFTMVNDAYAEMLGYEKDDLVGRHASLVADEAVMARARKLGEALEEGRLEEATLEAALRTADGGRVPTEATFALLPDTDGGWDRVGVVRDITERKRRERQLAESERRYRTLVENFPEGAVAMFDEDLRYTVAGGQLFQDVGATPGERVGNRITDIYPEDLVDDVERHFRAALEGEANSFEVELYGRHLYAHTVPVRDAADEIFAGMLVVQDVTERREYECRLEQSNERLEQFAYAASHDLQEPLRMVSSYLTLVEQRYADELDEDGREFIEFAVDGAERMREMIDALLAYSRVDTRGDPFQPVDLEDVLAAVRDDLQVRIEESGAAITAESMPTVVGDADQLRQVFQNLLDNAIEYSGDEPRVRVAAERDGDRWLVSVADEGIGIDPDQQDRVFEVFQRLHSREEHEGTGIGLALCERIVERHGGDIWVDSEPGEGATFSFTLPAAEAADE
jgi:PAS domain S-box-containing protein